MKIDFRHTHTKVISCFVVVLLIEIASLALTPAKPASFLRLAITIGLFIFTMKGSIFAKNTFAILLLLGVVPLVIGAFQMEFQLQTIFLLYTPALIFVLMGCYLLFSSNVKQFMAEMHSEKSPHVAPPQP